LGLGLELLAQFLNLGLETRIQDGVVKIEDVGNAVVVFDMNGGHLVHASSAEAKVA
jgi:hypothetical protein